MNSRMSCTPSLKSVFLFITNQCNLSCSFCAIPKDTPSFAEELSQRKVRQILAEARELGTDYITITGGEPFLRSDLGEIAQFAISKGIRVAIATNGTLLRSTTLQWAKSTGDGMLFIGVSIDGSCAETHDRLRGKKGCFDEAIQGIEAARESNIPVVIQTVLQKINLDQVYDISRMAASFQAEHRVIPEIMPKGRGNSQRDKNLTIQQILTVSDGLYELRKASLIDTFMNLPPALLPIDMASKMSMSCHWGVRFCGVMPNGDVAMCHGCDTCDMRVSSVFTAGNVHGTTLREIWVGSSTFAALRAFDPDSLMGVCGRCSLRSYCRGFCRVRAFLEYGALEGPEVLCQSAYDAGLFPEYLLSDE